MRHDFRAWALLLVGLAPGTFLSAQGSVSAGMPVTVSVVTSCTIAVAGEGIDRAYSRSLDDHSAAAGLTLTCTDGVPSVVAFDWNSAPLAEGETAGPSVPAEAVPDLLVITINF